MRKIYFFILFMLLTITCYRQNNITYSKDYLGNNVAKDQYVNILPTGKTDY
jgi:hypothetical protein